MRRSPPRSRRPRRSSRSTTGGSAFPRRLNCARKLRESDASFRIVKNRLTKIAADKAGAGERLNELLQGPTALTFVRGDTAQAAKAISTFNKEHNVLTFKGGFMDGISLDEERFKAIAKLPSRDVLNGQFAGVVASPLTGLVRGLGSMIQGLALQLGQIAEKGLVSGEAPAERPRARRGQAEELLVLASCGRGARLHATRGRGVRRPEAPAERAGAEEEAAEDDRRG